LTLPKVDHAPIVLSPQPRRTATLPAQLYEEAASFLKDQTTSSVSAGPGPTFLSTTSTPSPPSSPDMFGLFPVNPLRSNLAGPRNSSYPPITMPSSPPTTATFPMGSLYSTSGLGRSNFPSLMPLPLSPPTLKPSTKPPTSLQPPNPTTHDNLSPTSPPTDFPPDYPIAGYSHKSSSATKQTTSHSASASLSAVGPANVQRPRVKQRSPSQPHLPSHFVGANLNQPPIIPLRMSSIPANSKPRKLSLVQGSTSTLRAIATSEGKDKNKATGSSPGSSTPRKLTPPSKPNKDLPSAPFDWEKESQKAVEAISRIIPSHAASRTSRASPPRDHTKRTGQIWSDDTAPDTALAPPPASHDAEKPVKLAPKSKPPTTSEAPPGSQPQPLSQTTQSKKGKGKEKVTEQGGWAAATQTSDSKTVISRTQKDKERKKRSRAKVLIEHVDLIKDEFWERRPWILGGMAG
jgi:hypothetical protein